MPWLHEVDDVLAALDWRGLWDYRLLGIRASLPERRNLQRFLSKATTGIEPV